MRKDKEIAYELRQQGKSYKEISRLTEIPIGTLSGWFRDQLWSVEIRDRLSREASYSSPEKLKLMAEGNKRRWAKWHEECQVKAIKEYPKLKKNYLFLAGLMLYWGEGDKKLKNGVVRLSNTDPDMIKVFYLFLTRCANIEKDKIFISLLLYPDLVDSVSKNFWSKITGIPVAQFKKSIYIRGRHPKNRLSYGVCTIQVFSRELKEKITKWLELYKPELVRDYS